MFFGNISLTMLYEVFAGRRWTPLEKTSMQSALISSLSI
jgi:hypothetical protein